VGELEALFIVGTSCKKRASGGIVKSEASRYLELGMWES